jgi:prolycopene isomerase
LYDPSVAPPGCHILIVQKLVDVDYRATTDWQAHKAAIEAGILSDLERIVPGLAAKTEVSLSATAQTSWRYTLNEAGAMLGWEMSPDQLGTNRPSTTGPIENLHFVGHWTQPGGGITPVMVSAIQVAAAVGAPRRWELPRAGHPRSLATSLRGVVAECR